MVSGFVFVVFVWHNQVFLFFPFFWVVLFSRFYTLLVISTALFDKPPFKNLIVNGLVLAAWVDLFLQCWIQFSGCYILSSFSFSFSEAAWSSGLWRCCCNPEVLGPKPPPWHERDLFLCSLEFKSAITLCKKQTGLPPASCDLTLLPFFEIFVSFVSVACL